MNKEGIKNILISIRTSENEVIINQCLDKVEGIDEVSLENAVKKIGGTEEAVREFLEKKIFEIMHNDHTEERKPINGMSSYGINSKEKKSDLIRKISAQEIDGLEKIGEGKCANIYRKGSEVYKILKQNSNSRSFYSKEMLEQLVGIKSDLCVFPNEILENDNGELLGYTMDLVTGAKLNNIIKGLSFEELQAAVEQAEKGIEEVSKQGIIFDDMHYDNLMWNEETKRIQIIDTDFFKKTEDISNVGDVNYGKFNLAIQSIIGMVISQYGRKENEELIPFYDIKSLAFKEGKPLSTVEFILNLKEVMEKDFGTQFNSLSEVETALQEKQDMVEIQQHREQVANNLGIKEKFVRFLAQNKFLRKLPFVNKLIDKQIKMLPSDVQEIIDPPNIGNNSEQGQVATVGKSKNMKRKRFIEDLRNFEDSPQSNFTNIVLSDTVPDKRIEESKKDERID